MLEELAPRIFVEPAILTVHTVVLTERPTQAGWHCKVGLQLHYIKRFYTLILPVYNEVLLPNVTLNKHVG